jgi:lycopene beta-cyclase
MKHPNEYDYIIAGGGLSGLSLAFYLNQSPQLRQKKILIIDKDPKDSNDHTWCFWEAEPSPYEAAVCQQWQQVWFHGTEGFSALLPTAPYTYKMIRSADFYRLIKKELAQNPNISFLQTSIQRLDALNSYSVVSTEMGDFLAGLIFDSYSRLSYNKEMYQNMWQHFKGWVIETPNDAFRVEEPVLHDFRCDQQGDMRFVYVLPFSTRKALIEYTIFSDELLPYDAYDGPLKTYIEETLGIQDYQVVEEPEYGVVPMSDEPHAQIPYDRVIRIGTSGGYVKVSSGYSFKRTQNFLQQLIKELEAADGQFRKWQKDRKPAIQNRVYIPNWHGWLDSVMLNVLLEKRAKGAEIFTQLFKYNKTNYIFKFLDGKSSLWNDLKMMSTLPQWPFIRGAWAVFQKQIYFFKRFGLDSLFDTRPYRDTGQ